MTDDNMKILEPILPKGGSSFNGTSGTLQVDYFTGTSGIRIPIPVSASRELMPELGLEYNTSLGNGIFGMGFQIVVPAVRRLTSKGIPTYDDSRDIFTAEGMGELVRVSQKSVGDMTEAVYRPRVEQECAEIKYLKDNNGSSWQIITGENVVYSYGLHGGSRLCDPSDPDRVYMWMLEEVSDSRDNRMTYTYTEGTSNKYLHSIQYGSYYAEKASSQEKEPESRYLFEVIFDYGELDAGGREDFFSSYRSGFEIKTDLLCRNISVFHHLHEADRPILVKKTRFTYKGFPAMLESVQNCGYKPNEDGSYESMEMPPVTFEYTSFQPEKASYSLLESGEGEVPGYIGIGGFQLTDLYGEGIKGLLYTSGDSVMYCEPLGAGKYGKSAVQNPFPADRDMRQPYRMLASLEGNGEMDLVVKTRYRSGYYTFDEKNNWQQYNNFKLYPSQIENPMLEYADVSGDGQGDILMCRKDGIEYYRALRKAGYEAPACAELTSDFPLKSSSYRQEFVGFLQMFGDGLEHRVRVRSESVECWPNLGYGRFGSKIVFQNPPRFSNDFSISRLTFGDLNGTGTADFIYIGKDFLTIYPNMGNCSFGEPIDIPLPEHFTETDNIQAGDIMGKGTEAVVFTKSGKVFTHYIWDFSPDERPYLLKSICSNLGNLTTLNYSSSTEYYLHDKQEGTPWLYKMPSPVNVIESTVTEDFISGGTVRKSYRYRDGFYNQEKREFAGFGYIEEWVEETAADSSYIIPSVCTKQWFRTGGQEISGGMYGLDGEALPKHEDFFDHDPGKESYTALGGHLKRKEVYIRQCGENKLRDITDYNYRVSVLCQPKEGRKGVYRVTGLETVAYDYYNATDDPAVVHTLNLEEDGFGHATRVFTVNYPRRKDEGVLMQQSAAVSLQLYDYINETDNCGDTVFFITGLPYQSRSYEIHGGEPQLKCGAATYFTVEQARILAEQALANVLCFEEDISEDMKQARLFSWEKIFYWDESQENVFPLGKTGSRVLEHHREEAVYPEYFAENLYLDRFSDREDLEQCLQEDAGLCQKEGYWWNQSAVHYYYREGEQRFYLPYNAEYVQGKKRQVCRRREAVYDVYSMKIVSWKNWINEDCVQEIRGELDYISLEYSRITDANDNVSQVIYNPLGMVQAVSVHGITEERREGGMELAEYIAGQPTCCEDVAEDGKKYLQGASKYYYYDLFRFMKLGEPACSVVLERMNDESFISTYTFGDADNNPIMQKVKEDEGFCISGYMVNDSRGLPVLQYSPCYTEMMGYEKSPGEIPAPVVIYYDERGQEVRREQFAPNPTEQGRLRKFHSEIRRTPWEERVYDFNDILKDSEFYRAFQEHYPDTPDRDTADMKDALQKAEVFYDTPLVKLLDNRGNLIHEVNYDGSRTTNTYDIKNQLRSCRDSRISVCNFCYTLDMRGLPVRVSGADCGEKLHIYDQFGQISTSWDGRRLPVKMKYDWTGRTTAVFVMLNEVYNMVEKTVYGETSGLSMETIKNRNLSSQIYQYYDSAGKHTNICCNIYGSPVKKETQFCSSYTEIPDWESRSEGELLQAEIWTEEAVFNDCNMPVSNRAPDSSETLRMYTVSGKVRSIAVDNRTGHKEIISDIRYDAAGLKQDICFGNKVHTKYKYDPATRRLLGIYSTRQENDVFQNDIYTYDPMGNMTRMRDETQRLLYNKQQTVEPVWNLTYDPHYRLTEATGRELLGADCNDREKLERYKEEYTYDNSGNLTGMRHTSPSVKYTRSMNPVTDSNRIVDIEDSGDSYKIGYDENGNMLNLRNIKKLTWNYRNQMAEAIVIERESDEQDGEYYVYDGGGNRIRKIIRKKISEGLMETEEWVYLGAFQSKKIYRNDALVLERHLLQIDTQGQTEVLLYYWEKDDLRKETGEIHRESIHYVFSGITGSAAMELDEDGNMISREEYYPYGGTAVMTGRSHREVELKQYRYKGREKDSVTGLYCFGVRYYAPWMGRWISADPAGTMEGLNLYQYAGNNPITYEDKSGKAAGARGGNSEPRRTPPLPDNERDRREVSSKLRRRIGVLYRSDGGGAAHYWDLDAVRQTNPGADVVTIISPYNIANHPKNFKKLPDPETRQSDLAGINAVFVPGGPAAHPAQDQETNHSKASKREHEVERHNFETAMIQQALTENIPILAVCGGSWRLGHVLGAGISALPKNRTFHNGGMHNVNDDVHPVHVRGGTMLRRIIGGGFSSLDGVPAGGADITNVNSVHWASSVFAAGGNVAISADGVLRNRQPDRITEAYEAVGRHFVMGIQWHPEYTSPGSQAENSRIMYALGFAALENRAAQIIQTGLRNNRDRRRNVAATIIQRAFRGNQARRQVQQAGAAAGQAG